MNRRALAVPAALAVGLLTSTALTLTPTVANRVYPPYRPPAGKNVSPVTDAVPVHTLVSLTSPVSRDFLRVALTVPISATVADAPAPHTPPVAAGRGPRPATQTSLVRASGSQLVAGGPVNAQGEGAATGPTPAQTYARSLVPADQWPCLDALWQHESNWRSDADNPRSTAFGIAQRLDETSHDPQVQIVRGLAYIAARYGTACRAWAFWQQRRWY